MKAHFYLKRQQLIKAQYHYLNATLHSTMKIEEIKTTKCIFAGAGDPGGALQVEGGKEVGCRGEKKT